MKEVIDKISRVRFPTDFSGFSLGADRRMQHPTRPRAGYFGDSQERISSSLHARLDTERKAAVLEAMRTAAGQSDWTPESVADAGLVVAIGFTLNRFAAPISARDVLPHSRMAKAPPAARMRQVHGREELKKIKKLLGGIQQVATPGTTQEQALTAAWVPPQGLLAKSNRETSPSRTEPPPASAGFLERLRGLVTRLFGLAWGMP
jgi:hypothetical protein